MFHLLFFIVSVVHKHFKTKRIVFVLSDCEPVISDQKSVCSQTVAIKKLISFLVTSPVSCIHCEIDFFHVWIIPFLISFSCLCDFLVHFNTVSTVLVYIQSIHPVLIISLQQNFIIFYQAIDHIRLYKFFFFLLPLINSMLATAV